MPRDDDYVHSLAHAIGDEPALAHLPTSDLPTFGSVYREKRSRVTTRQLAAAVVIAAAISGPFAIVGALTGPGGALSAFVLVAVVGPVVEELLKVSGGLYLTEAKPWLVPSGTWLILIAVIAGLVFATIENAFYLWVLIDDPSPEIIRWRWIFGPLVHGVSSLIAGIGVARMWTELDRTHEPARFLTATPWLIAAVVVHGTYNATVTIWELLGGGF